MPLLGKEEPAAFARQSSSNNAGAGVPIKKRRFPVIRPSSPPPQEPTSLPAKNDSVDNNHLGTSQGSSFMNATDASNSVGKFNAVKNPLLEVKKEIVADPNSNLVRTGVNVNVSVSGAKPKEPNLATQSDAIEKSQLNLAPKENLASLGNNVMGKQVPLKCKPEPFPTTDEYALGPKEPLVPALMGQNREVSHQMPGNLYPSLSLSLSKEKCVDRSKTVEATVNNDTVVSANRSNWDLNTTMDAWEGSVGDAPPLDTVGFNGLNKIDGSLDTSPSLMSLPELGVNVDSGKQILGAGDRRPDYLVSSLPSTQYRAEDLLHLSLSPSFTQTNFSMEPSGSSANMRFASSANMPFSLLANMSFASSAILASGSSANIATGSSANVTSGSSASIPFGSSANMHSGSSALVNSSMAVDYSKLLGQLVSTKNITAGINVKPEPFDGSSKPDSVAAIGNSVDAKQVSVAAKVNSVGAKHDSGEAKGNSVESSTIVKKEVMERCSKNDFTLHDAISTEVVEDRPIKSEPTQDINKETPKLTESIMHRSAGTVLQSQDNVSPTTRAVLMPEKSCSSGLPPPSGLSLSSDVSNQELSAKKAAIPVQDKSIVNTCRAEDSNVIELPNSRGNAEAFGSDDEKINISTDMMEEDSYGSDSESDGHATKGTRSGKEEEDYEDGEVRESMVQNVTVNVQTDERKENLANCGDCDLNSLGLIGNGNLNQYPVEDKDQDFGDVVSEDHIKECVDSGIENRSNQILDKGVTFQEPLAVEEGPARAEAESSLNATQRRLDETEGLSDEGPNGGGKGTETETAVGDVPNENANENDEREKDDSCLPTTDSSLNGQQDAAKDTDSGGGSGRSRIITLPRASNVVSPSKTRSIPDRSFVWGTGKERYADFEGDKLHLRRNRDEIFTDGPRRFVRERFQDQSFRGSRMKFVRGRGRGYNRYDRSEWVSSDRKFNPENYSGPAEYRFSRNKHDSAGDEEFESNGYPVAEDGDLVGSGRGGRKPLGNDFPSFRNPALRRLSPRGRGGGPTTRGIQMVRRIARNISPNGEEGSDMVGHRHGDKFMRNLPDDIIDPMMARSQHPNEGLEDQFARGNRKFVQRRGLPRVRSKSPMRTRTRSPGPWSSPRRRSPNGYNGIPELTRQRRSPPLYRMERIRSPPLNFPDEIVARRRGSPPYIARPLNDLQLRNQRPIMANRRSPSDRPIPRNNRRFDNSLDPQERTNTGEYFEGPIRASRFHEIGEEGSGDDRRKLGERRGGRGPFRPSFSGSGGENFRFHQESGPRPFRFSPEGDSEFVERSGNNFREREFDRRIKNRPVIPPRRMRGVEEQEGDFRQGGPVWNDDGFGDNASRGKRRRF